MCQHLSANLTYLGARQVAKWGEVSVVEEHAVELQQQVLPKEQGFRDRGELRTFNLRPKQPVG